MHLKQAERRLPSEDSRPRSSMRVLMILNGDDRAESRVRRAAETLASIGSEVVVLSRLTKRNRSLGHNEFTEGVEYRRVKFRITKVPILKRIPAYLHMRFDRETRRFIRDFKPQFIHAHDLTSLRMAAVAAKRTDARVIYDSHEYFTDELPETPWAEKLYISIVEKKYIKRADAVITVSSGIADLLESKYQIPRPVVVHNSVVPLPLDANLKGEATVRSTIGLTSSDTLAVYVGGRHVSRGVATLVRALADISDLHLAMVGAARPDHDEPLRQLAKTLGCADRLHLVEPVRHNDVASFISTADFGIVPQNAFSTNIVHSLPNKFFECMFSGLPFLYSDLPAMRQISERTGLGRPIDCSSSETIAEAVRAFLHDYRNCRPSPERYQAAIREFAWPAEAAKLTALYESLCDHTIEWPQREALA